MAEVVRSIKAVVEVDTNKRTVRREIEADSLADLRDRVLDIIGDMEGGL